MDGIVFSYSKLKTYSDCPCKYKLKYKRNLKNICADNEIFRFGDACHIAFRDYDQHLKSTGRRRDYRYLIKRIPEWFASVNGVDGARYQEFRHVMLTFARHHKLNPETLYGSEIALTVDRDGNPVTLDDPRAFLTTKIDRIDIDWKTKSAVIIDYKTSKSIASNPLQLIIYALVVLYHFPEIESVSLYFDYVRYSLTQSLFNEKGIPHQKSRSWIMKYWPYVLALSDRCLNDVTYAPNVSASCEQCPYAALCPAQPVIPNQVNSYENAKKIAESVLVLEKDLRLLKPMLARYIDKNGSVTVHDVTFDLEAYQRMTADIVPLMIECQKHGLKPEDYQKLFKINSQGVKQLAKKNRELTEIMTPHLYCTGYTQLTHFLADPAPISDPDTLVPAKQGG